jgi:PqqD family protein of HPr-rel-A system
MTTLDLSRLHDLAVSDSGFVLDPRTGHTFTLNESGLLVLRSLKDGAPLYQIVDRLESEFDVDPNDNVRRDVDDFVSNLREMGLAQ